MRSQLVDAATAAFLASGIGGASLAEIARAAGAFPSQVTYYFGSKEALFVEAACRELLYVARAAEEASAAAVGETDYVNIMIRHVLGAPGLVLFIEAIALARREPALQARVRETFLRLDEESGRAYADHRARQGHSSSASAAPAHRFWALAIGLTARGVATGEPTEELATEFIALLRVGAAAI